MSFLFLLYITLFIFSFYRNRDIFAPSKVYLIVFGTFYGQVFWLDQGSLEVDLIVLFILLFSILIIIFELKIKISHTTFIFSKKKARKLIYKLWLLSLIPIGAQFYLFKQLGGFELFIMSIGSRVQDWQGLGPIISLIKIMNIISYIYFIIIVKSYLTKSDKILFYIHFLIFIVIALLSGSRSNLLWNIVFMLIFYHYSVKKVNILKALSGFIIVLILAMLIGVARGGYTMEEGQIKSGIDSEKNILNMTNFIYGLQPLHKILEYNSINSPQYGLTYLTAVTNLVPRSIWPGKPDTGGVIITRDYFGDPFGGLSNYTTGLFPEAIINFSFLGGSIFAFLFISIAYILFFMHQHRLKNSTGINQLIMQGSYPFFLFGLPSYIYAEFTTNTLSMFIFKFGIFIMVFKIILIKFNVKKGNNELK